MKYLCTACPSIDHTESMNKILGAIAEFSDRCYLRKNMKGNRKQNVWENSKGLSQFQLSAAAALSSNHVRLPQLADQGVPSL